MGFSWDDTDKILTVTTSMMVLKFQNGYVIYCQDVASSEVLVNTSDTGTDISANYGGNSAYIYKGYPRIKADGTTSGEVPAIANITANTPISDTEYEIEYTPNTGCKITYNIVIDATGEVLITTTGEAPSGEELVPAYLSLSIMNAAVSGSQKAVIAGAYKATYASTTLSPYLYLHNGRYPQVAVVEGTNAVLGAWSEQDQTIQMEVYLTHVQNSYSHLTFTSHTDPVQYASNKYTIIQGPIRFATKTHWLEVARRWRERFIAQYPDSKYLWENACSWVRNIHTIYSRYHGSSQHSAWDDVAAIADIGDGQNHTDRMLYYGDVQSGTRVVDAGCNDWLYRFDGTAIVPTDDMLAYWADTGSHPIGRQFAYSFKCQGYQQWILHMDPNSAFRGSLSAVSLNAPGSGYTAGNSLTVTGGYGSGGKIIVDAVGGGGEISTYHVDTSNRGSNYLPTLGVSVSGGSGSNATFDITAVNVANPFPPTCYRGTPAWDYAGSPACNIYYSFPGGDKEISYFWDDSGSSFQTSGKYWYGKACVYGGTSILLHPGGTDANNYLAYLLPNYYERTPGSRYVSAYFDVLGVNYDGYTDEHDYSQSNHNVRSFAYANMRLKDGKGIIQGSVDLIKTFYDTYPVMPEEPHCALIPYIFYSFWGGTRMAYDYGTMMPNHPLCTALRGSFLWTQDTTPTLTPLSPPAPDKPAYNIPLSAILGCLPEFMLTTDYESDETIQAYTMARATMFIKFKLHNDLPATWQSPYTTLGYYRSNTGNMFRFEDRGGNVYAYVEEHWQGDYDRLVFDSDTYAITDNIDDELPSILYSRYNYAVLPTDDADLTTIYSTEDIADVATDDTDMVPQSATSQIAIHQFKQQMNGAGGIINVVAQVTIPCSTSTTYLQIYNRSGTPAWDTIDSDNATGANTDFTLSATVADLTDYKDENNIVACRVYQEMQ